VISTPALAVVLYLAYASFFVLKVLCIFCVITYVAVVGLFLVSGAATSVPILSLPARAIRDFRVFVSSPVAIALSMLLVAASAGTLAYFPREGAPAAPVVAQNVNQNPTQPPAGGQQTELERMMSTSTRVPIDVPAEGAGVLVVKFNDYQCPACAQSYLLYKPVFAKYQSSSPGAVRVVLKDFPLEPECNAGVRTVLHEAACEAAVAVRLARERNRGEAMEDWLYSNQASMTPDSVRRAAREVGTVADFDDRYDATLELVKADAALGVQLGIRSTPTFFINGVKVEGAWQPQYFDQAIAYELKHAP
jgi:protein-disulfide isomerase